MALTPIRQMRFDDDLWSRVTGLARETDSTATEIVRQAIEKYVVNDRLMARRQLGEALESARVAADKL